MSVQDPATRLAHHGQARSSLLDNIRGVLEGDARFVAAWLTNSLAWGMADDWSDIDLHAVIADNHYANVVAERRNLYQRFGSPVLVQEIKENTESPAHFNLLVYPGGLEVDCSLWTYALAHRPAVSRLLFDRAGIPVDPVVAMSSEESRDEAEHQLNFFWAMAVVAMKCVGRSYTAGAAQMVEMLLDAYDCLWRLIWRPDQPHPEAIRRRHRPIVSELAERTPRLDRVIDPLTALDVIRRLCAEVERLHPILKTLGVVIPVRMPEEVAMLGDLAESIVRDRY